MSKKSSELRNLSRRLAGVTMPIVRRRMRWGRNWPCLCGSGQKYKKCCMAEMNEITASDGNADVVALPENIQKMVDARCKVQTKGGMKKNG